VAVEVYLRVDGKRGMWRFLECISGRYLVLSPSGRPCVVFPWQCRIVAHRPAVASQVREGSGESEIPLHRMTKT